MTDKIEKSQKNLWLTADAKRLLAKLAAIYGTEAAAVERAVRDLAKKEKVN